MSGGVTAGVGGLLVGDRSTAMSFDGTTGTVGVTVPGIDTTAGHQVTVEFWMSWPVTGPSQWVFSFNSYGLVLLPGTGFGFNTNNSDIYGVAPPAVPANTPLHVVAVFVNGNVQASQLFINGVQQTLTQLMGTPLSPSVTTAANISGVQRTTIVSPFKGTIGQVAVYNGALTPPQVQRHYQAGTAQAPTTYSGTVLADQPFGQPTGFWKLGDPAGSGTAADASGNGRAGTVHSGVIAGLPPATTDGDTTMGFGNLGYVSLADSSVLHPSSFSVEAWAYKTADVSRQRVLSVGSWPSQSYTIEADNTGKLMAMNVISSTTTAGVGSLSAIPLNQWVYLVMTYDGSTIHFYVNGVLQGSAASAAPEAGSGGLGIGADPNGGNPWNGRLADVALYGQKLTAAQVLRHYQAGLGQAALAANGYTSQVLADGPRGYWRLGEAAGQTAADQSGSGRDGSYVGGVSLGQVGALPSDPGTAASLDGSSGYVTLGSTPQGGAFDFSGNAPFSVEAWVTIASYPASNSWPRILSREVYGTSRSGYGLPLFSDGTIHFERWVNGAEQWLTTRAAVSLNVWRVDLRLCWRRAAALAPTANVATGVPPAAVVAARPGVG